MRKREHAKASETYLDVIFRYDTRKELKTSVPIQYRHTGTDIDAFDNKAIDSYLAYPAFAACPQCQR
ncbi:MAG: hypothetical protein ACTTIO_07020 [Candidatus Fimenecus sp.]